jgi:haloalkane dehalogenase
MRHTSQGSLADPGPPPHGERVTQHRIDVLDTRMAYREAGQGDPIVFLHGNPTSSFLWRKVIPHVAPFGRCIAPDLVGFGDSDKLPASGPDRYHFEEQRRYLDAFLETANVRERVTLVLHDWGSVLGFDWANRHREAVHAMAYMEATVRNVRWQDLPAEAVPLYEALRSPRGEELILQQNLYIETALPRQIARRLGAAEMETYRAPFREEGESRRPILSLCRDVPLDGTPRAVHDAQVAYARWLAETDVPKLFVNAEPGSFLVGELRELCRAWRNQHEVTVRGRHFVQEDSPDDIGRAIGAWLSGPAGTRARLRRVR